MTDETVVPTDQANDPVTETGSKSRRSFAAAAMAGVISVLLGVVPLIYSCLFFLDPLLGRRSGRSRGARAFIDLGLSEESLPSDGTPLLANVRADKEDAWNKFLQVPVGSVWLRRIGNQVIAFNTKCPHLGCTVDYRMAEDDFYCPCHTSAFDLNGEKTNEVPPRGMDVLDVEVREGRIHVGFRNFRTATPEKIPI